MPNMGLKLVTPRDQELYALLTEPNRHPQINSDLDNYHSKFTNDFQRFEFQKMKF